MPESSCTGLLVDANIEGLLRRVSALDGKRSKDIETIRRNQNKVIFTGLSQSWFNKKAIEILGIFNVYGHFLIVVRINLRPTKHLLDELALTLRGCRLERSNSRRFVGTIKSNKVHQYHLTDSKSKTMEFQLPLKLTEDHEMTRGVRTESTASDERSREDGDRCDHRRLVRFDLQNTRIIPIKGLTSMTDDERQAYWYSQEAYVALRGCAGITLQLMGLGHPEQFGHCYRGLESCLPENQKIIHNEITLSIYAVFREQSRQKGKGISNPSSLRTAYRKTIRSSTERALAAAKEDREAAAAYQKEYTSSRTIIATRSHPVVPSDVEDWDADSCEENDVSVVSTDSAWNDDRGSIAHPVKSNSMMKRLKKFVQGGSKTRRSQSGCSISNQEL